MLGHAPPEGGADTESCLNQRKNGDENNGSSKYVAMGIAPPSDFQGLYISIARSAPAAAVPQIAERQPGSIEEIS